MRLHHAGMLCLLGWIGCAPSTPPSAPPGPAQVVRVPAEAEDAERGSVLDVVHDCAATVTEWDVHQCVRRLSPSEQRARPFSNRLHFRDGRLLRHEQVNGHGELVNDANRCAAWDYEYDGNWVRRVICTDRNGTVQGQSQISKDRRDYFWQDAWGRPRPMPNTEAVGLRRRHDARGRVLEYMYLDRHGHPIPNSDGVYVIRAPRNDQGAIVEESFFDAQGAPMVSKQGCHRVVYDADEFGDAHTRRWFGIDGSPCTDIEGVHSIGFEHDQAGNRLARHSFGANGEPVLERESGASSVTYERDPFGTEIRRTYRGLDGNPIMSRWGYSIQLTRVDERGRDVRWEHFDESGQPVARKEGHHAMAVTYDARGYTASERYFDVAGAPTRVGAGYAAVAIENDRRGNPNARDYFDVDGQLMTLPGGYCRWVAEYDKDQLTRELFLDQAGRRVNHLGRGWAERRVEYDSLGQMTGERTFDAAGNEL